MRVDKQTLVEGFISYVDKEVVPYVDDKGLQIILSIGVNTLRTNNKLIDSILNNNVVLCLVDKDEDNTYELNNVFEVIDSSISKHGYFPVTIPAIKFISNSEKVLKFYPADFKKLKTYMEGTYNG